MKWYECFPGQIVYIKHYDEFLKKFTAHPYLVYGREGFRSGKKQNIVCLRITSRYDDMEDKVFLPHSICNSLDKDSAIVYNAEHLFDVKDALLIGQCEHWILLDVITKRREYLRQQDEDMIHAYENIKKYQDKYGVENNPHYIQRQKEKGCEV